MKEQSVTTFLNDLVEVFLQNSIFYIPHEIIFDGILDKLEGEIDANFFDKLSFLDINREIFHIKSEYAIEVNKILFEKRTLLEKNIFILLEKKDDFTPIVFQVIIEKYYDQLIFYLFITEWFTLNLKKYNDEGIHISIVGAFKIQHENLSIHLKDFYNYFEPIIDIHKNHDFSTEKLINEHFPNLISRFIQTNNKSVSKNIDEINSEITIKQHTEEENQPEEKLSKKKKQRPKIIDMEIEKMILKGIFGIKI